MFCSTPDLLKNRDLAIERQKKILDIMTLWYKTATRADPPPITDPSILSYNSKAIYYYTDNVQKTNNVLNLVIAGLNAALSGISGVSIDFNLIANLVAQSLADTTQNETSQGYSTCVSKTFEGEFMGKRCLYKPMVVAVSFNFSASEYESSASVAAFGYWVYLFCIESPLFSASGSTRTRRLRSFDGQRLTFELPNDMEIIGRKLMTKAELDAFRPGTAADIAEELNTVMEGINNLL